MDRVFDETVHLVPEFDAAHVYARDVTACKQAEDAVRTHLERFYTVLSSMHTGLLLVSDKSRVEFANQAFCDYFDLSDSPADLVGLTASGIVAKISKAYLHPDEAVARIEEIVDRGEPVKGEDVAMADGRELLRDFIPIQINGQSYGRLWYHIDITDRKRAGETLRKAHKELEQRVLERTEAVRRQADLLDLAYNAVLVCDMESRIIFWNAGAKELYGWTKDEALGMAVHTFLKTQFPVPFDEYATALEQGCWEGELVHATKDGRQITVLSRQGLQRDETGNPLAILEVNLDITKRKEAEKAFLSAVAYNRSLIEASLDPLVTITAEGKISDVNAATESITGRVRQELIGTDFSDYFTEPEKARAGYQEVFHRGYVRDYPLQVRHKDGHAAQVLYNASTYRDNEGNVLGVFAAARDITAQLEMEEQLRQSHKMEAIGTLAGGIAHDFNNMLAVIIGNAELALDELRNQGLNVT